MADLARVLGQGRGLGGIFNAISSGSQSLY